MAAESSPGATARAPVWDAAVRLFHWTLVLLMAFSWWSGERHDMAWHRLSGYAILALVVFRLYWGVAGGRTARFAQFVKGPRTGIAYARGLIAGRDEAPPGHNPIGGWSVIVMLAALVAMVVAGLFAVDVDGLESGPLADYVSFDQGRLAAAAHELIFNLLLALVALHVIAILFHLIRLRHDLIGPMIHGRGPAGARHPAEPLGASPWRALAGIVAAALFAWWAARGFRL